MKKAASAVLTVFKTFIWIGFGIQIILGVIWMCFNMSHLQSFAGQGSSLFQSLVPMLSKVYLPVYLLQLALALWSGYDFFRRLLTGTQPGFAVGGALALCTFPFALQCHLAIAPFSVVSSLSLVLLGRLAEALRGEKSVQSLFVACLAWVGSSLFLPTYFLVGLVAMAMYLLLLCFDKGEKRRFLASLVLVAAFGGLLLGVNALALREQMVPDAEQRAYSLCSRMSWPTLMPDHERWPEVLNEVVDAQVWEVSLYADRMEEVFRPLVTGNFGETQAAEYYRWIAGDSWNRHKNLIVRQIAGDFAAYTATAAILPIQLAGKAYASYSGRNYELFLQQAPQLSKWYLTYSVRWFVLMPVAAVVVTLLRLASLWGEHRKNMIYAVLLFGFTGLAAGLLYTFRGAGIMDYKCCVFVNLLWPVWALALTAERTKEK